jgi:trigger factor
MQVQIEDISPVEKKLAVEIPWENVREKLETAYRELGKGVELRGFRKGKVPRSVLERMFGRQVQLEVAKALVQESFLKAAEDHKIEPVAEPVVEDARIKSGEAFRYSARIEIRSHVELKEYLGLAVTRRPAQVTDPEVEQALEHKRQRQTEYRVIDRQARDRTAASDVVLISLKGKVGDFPIDRPEMTVDLGHTDHEPLPGLAARLQGLPIETEGLELQFEIPADVPQKELAGKSATLKVTIKEAREKVVPTLDDEFAKDTGEADTLAELKDKIREGLVKEAEERIARDVKDELLKELVKKNPLPVAPALIERSIDGQLERARMSLAMQGIDVEKAGVDLQGMRENVRESAADEVRGQLLLEAIADKEEIAVAEADVDARVAELAALRDKPAHKMKAELDRDGRLESLRFRLRQEKALDLVLSRATITESAETSPSATAGKAESTSEASKE